MASRVEIIFIMLMLARPSNANIIKRMIRKAGPADFEAVIQVREQLALDTGRLDDPVYRLQIQRSGFLLATDLSEEEFAASSANYELAERDGKIIGYIRLESDQDISEDEIAHWNRPEMEEIYYTNPHAYVWGIGVLPEAKGKGVAVGLLEVAEKRARAQAIPWLFSEIVAGPVTNIASMIFHEKNGFQRLATGKPREHAGMHGFYEILYAKQLM